MADNSSNIINPIQGPQNVQGMASAKRREQRKNRQNNKDKHKHRPDEDLQDINDLFEDEQPVNNEPTKNDDEQHEIDYRA